MDELTTLCDLDHLISLELEKNEINAEEISRLVDNREQILQNLLNSLERNPELKHNEEWQQAIIRTKRLFELMQSETSKIGKELYKFRHGQRSLQQYKRFT